MRRGSYTVGSAADELRMNALTLMDIKKVDKRYHRGVGVLAPDAQIVQKIGRWENDYWPCSRVTV